MNRHPYVLWKQIEAVFWCEEVYSVFYTGEPLICAEDDSAAWESIFELRAEDGAWCGRITLWVADIPEWSVYALAWNHDGVSPETPHHTEFEVSHAEAEHLTLKAIGRAYS